MENTKKLMYMGFIALCTGILIFCILLFYMIPSYTNDNISDSDSDSEITIAAPYNSMHEESYYYIPNALINAVFASDYDQVERLIESGEYSVDDQDETGATVLFYAAGAGDYHMVEILLELGANPNMPDEHNDIPLNPAVNNNSYDVVTLLMQYGSNPLLVNSFGKTPLSSARNVRMRDILQATY